MLSATSDSIVGTGLPRKVRSPRQGTPKRRVGVRECVGDLLCDLLRMYYDPDTTAYQAVFLGYSEEEAIGRASIVKSLLTTSS